MKKPPLPSLFKSVWLWSSVLAFMLFLIYTGRFNPSGIFDFLKPAQDDTKEVGQLSNLATGLSS